MLDGSEVWDGGGRHLAMCEHGMMASRGDCARCVNATRQQDMGEEGCEAEGVLAEIDASQIDQSDWPEDDARWVPDHLDRAPGGGEKETVGRVW